MGLLGFVPRSGNIAKWMGENVEEIMRDSRDPAIGEKIVRGAAWAADRHFWRDSGRRSSTELKNKQHHIVTHPRKVYSDPLRLVFVTIFFNPFNGITEKYKL